jgi:hypothetical protein
MIYIQKTMPAPDCLALEKAKAHGTYNCEGVLAQNKIDFKNKCYICEDKEPHAINTEHFVPHRGNNDLKFDWENLFFCCSHCNNTKLAIAKYDEILNCTIETDDVEVNIKYNINPFPMEKAVILAVTNNQKTLNTVDLLLEVYNGTTPLKKIESANLRSKLLKEIRDFQTLLFEFYDDSYNAEEKEEIKNKIIRQLRPTSNFTAFKKWIIKDNEVLLIDFTEHL